MAFTSEDKAARDAAMKRSEDLAEQARKERAECEELLRQHFPDLKLSTAIYLWDIACAVTDQLRTQYRQGKNELRIRRLEKTSFFNDRSWDGRWHVRGKDDGTLLTSMARLYDDIGQSFSVTSEGRIKMAIEARAPLPAPARP